MKSIEFLQNTRFEKPTEMQENYFQVSHPSTILLSATGSGKTLAYQLKLLKILSKNSNDTVLILCPTRELAMQAYSNWTQLKTSYTSVLCYGGHSFKNESLQLSQKPTVIFGTPGRILDHYNRETEGIQAFAHLILDEYDKTLEMGFLKEITAIYAFANPLKSIQLISATAIEKTPDFLEKIQFETYNNLTNIAPSHTFFNVSSTGHDKLSALIQLIAALPLQPIIVFCTHRDATERISELLYKNGKSNVLFHGGMDQQERERALIKFKNGSENCLVCTDLAARGLDIPDIYAVVHYQYPHTLQDFTHRNGRTARMDKEGKIFLIHSEAEPLPSYLEAISMSKYSLKDTPLNFTKSKWMTLYINIGRKNKIRKMDIAGFFMKDLQINAEEVGIIDVFDNHTYIAITQKAYSRTKDKFFKTKIKKVSARISICR